MWRLRRRRRCNKRGDREGKRDNYVCGSLENLFLSTNSGESAIHTYLGNIIKAPSKPIRMGTRVISLSDSICLQNPYIHDPLDDDHDDTDK